MSLITYALLVAGTWYTVYRVAVGILQDELKDKREEYAKDRKSYYPRMADPDAQPYPWGKLIPMVVVPSLLLMLVMLIPAFFWKTTWFIAFWVALYFFCGPFKRFADRTWDSLKNKKASYEAKLRG